jgi:hypothetical protein
VITPILYRVRDAAEALGVSESQIAKFERKKLLRAVRIPGVRAKRYAAAEVQALGQSWIDRRQESAS